MNLTILPLKAPGPDCSKEDCANSATSVVNDADSGVALVFYCNRHTRELAETLRKA